MDFLNVDKALQALKESLHLEGGSATSITFYIRPIVKTDQRKNASEDRNNRRENQAATTKKLPGSHDRRARRASQEGNNYANPQAGSQQTV